MTIKPDYLTLDNLLQKKLFRVPEYQRAYSWQVKHRGALFDDIKKLRRSGSDRHHFMATIVCLQTKQKEEVGVDEFNVVNIVDGQQRLTTLIIMLKAISKKLAGGNEDEKKEANKINELLIKGDNRLILLQTNHDSSSLFKNYLVVGEYPELKLVRTAAESPRFELPIADTKPLYQKELGKSGAARYPDTNIGTQNKFADLTSVEPTSFV